MAIQNLFHFGQRYQLSLALASLLWWAFFRPILGLSYIQIPAASKQWPLFLKHFMISHTHTRQLSPTLLRQEGHRAIRIKHQSIKTIQNRLNMIQ